MSEVIVITSGKGGVGKTTTSANLGTGLAMLNKKVVLIDTDIGLRNLDVVMGLENRIVYNLVDVIEGSCRMSQALIKDKRYPNLQLLPSAQTRDKSSVSPEQMKKLIDSLSCWTALQELNRDLKMPLRALTEPLSSRLLKFPRSGTRTGSSGFLRPMKSIGSI